jgi:protein-S-isoprenylcysteine O-methyltransferase Ste14
MRLLLFAIAAAWVWALNRRYMPKSLKALRARCSVTRDMIALRLCQLLTLVLSLLGGNDVPLPLVIAGLFLYCAGQILILIAANENPYFIPTIAPPPVVITTGVYKHLRHPGYVGHMISLAGVWLIWSSLAALVPLLGFMGLLCWRAHKENGVIQPKSWNASSLSPPRSSP